MNKKLPALLLALCLLLSIPVQAAQDSTENFIRQRTYENQFSDLVPGSTFYDNAAALYEYGLSNGKSDGSFGLNDPMTVGQIVIFAGRIRSLYRLGNAEAGPAVWAEESGPAALGYLRYLQSEGILGPELDGRLSEPATRAEVAHVLAGVLPEEALPSVNNELVTVGYSSRRYITDVTEYTPYYTDILTLYRRGVSAGSDAQGSFLPDSPITRGAAAAMLTRMVDPALRVRPQWDLSRLYSAQGTLLSDLVEPGTFYPSPASAGEMDSTIRHMLARGEHQLLLYYPGVTAPRAKEIMESALEAVKVYCEQSYNAVNCTYVIAGPVTLSFTAAGAGDRLEEYRAAAMEAAVAVHDQLWENGTITTDMTDREKALIYYDWICSHCVYDYQARDDSLSHIAYSLFANGTAVCDGYTGAYNMLLKLEGIQCYALANDSHIWTVAVLDGETVHIDTTWGDSGSAVSYDYFAMTPEQSRRYHAW